MLDQKDVEAVIICTADHHHAFIANWALNRDMHVYCEKPLGITVEEVRTVRANYLKRKSKVATQHGTQRHAYPNFERLRELILDGAIGELKTVHSWDSRQLPRPGYPAAEGQPPAFLHYEQWIGPSPYHPYSPQYFGGSNGLNCLFWNMYRDFGVGQMGDMGAHTMDLVWNAIDAGAPTAIEIDQEVSDKYNPDICPVKLKASFEHPANSWRGPVHVGLVSGRAEAEIRRGATSTCRGFRTARFSRARRARIVADFTTRMILPNNDDGDFTYYKRRDKGAVLPLIGGTGQVTQGGASLARAGTPSTRQPLGLPAASLRCQARNPDPTDSRWFRSIDGKVPAALGLPNPSIEPIVKPRRAVSQRAGSTYSSASGWMPARARATTSCTARAARRIATSITAGSMMEQMLLGSGRAPGRQEAGVRPAHRPRNQLGRSERVSEAHVPAELDTERVELDTRSFAARRCCCRTRIQTAPRA